jgi:transposase InsO family protein
MTETEKTALTSKWALVVSEYELVKQKRSKSFKTVADICQAYKVHRKDIRKYYERWAKSGKNRDALLPKKRGPRPGQLKILSKEEERTILKINRRLGANEFEIYELIKEHHNGKGKNGFKVHPSVSTIYRTFKRYPLNAKRKEKIKRYEKKYPGELAHTDTLSLGKTVFVERKRYHLLGLLDDCTRLCYAELIPDAKAATVSRAFFHGYKWFHAHGIRIEEVLSDNGVEFTAYTSQKAKDTHFFETMLNICGIKHRYIRPYRPQTNGKIERFWRILNDECLSFQEKSQTKEEFVAELNGFMYRYNYQRRHGGLHYQTPLDKLNFVTEIMK